MAPPSILDKAMDAALCSKFELSIGMNASLSRIAGFEAS